jgi:hypothetical protein
MKNDLEQLHQAYIAGIKEALDIPDGWMYVSTFLPREEYVEAMELAEDVGREHFKFIEGNVSNGVVKFSVYLSPVAGLALRKFMRV